jgi:hypothetical protein
MAVSVRAAESALFDAEVRLDEALELAEWSDRESRAARNLMRACNTLGV